MDNGNGNFERISDVKFEEQMLKPEPMVFKVGEIIEIRGSRFYVEKIRKNKITFKLLPKFKKQENGKNRIN